MQTQVMSLLIDKISDTYKNDVSILVMMGSRIYHEAHKKSDIDLYFVPKTERGYQLGMVFVLDGIGYDIWPISWERLTRIAHHEERLTSIVTDGHILYVSSDEDLIRFNVLKTIALDASHPEDYYDKASGVIKGLYESLYRLNEAKHIKDVRTYAIMIINGLCHAISLMNLSMIKKGRSHLKKEVMAMSIRPKDFEPLIDTVFETDNMDSIKQAYKQLFDQTQTLLKSLQNTDKSSNSFIEAATGFYEEIINYYNKIERAYEIGNHKTPLFMAAEIDHEIRSVIGHDDMFADLPSLTAAYDRNDLKAIYETSKKHQDQLYDILKTHGVDIRIFEDFETFKKFLQDL